MTGHGVLKPLRHPRLWLALWTIALVVVVVVCLVPAPDLPDTPPGGDKIEHALAYFLLAASAVQLFATRRALIFAGIGLLVLGVLIEFAQGAFTTTRSGDAWDAVADAVGVVLGLALARTPLRDLLARFDAPRG